MFYVYYKSKFACVCSNVKELVKVLKAYDITGQLLLDGLFGLGLRRDWVFYVDVPEEMLWLGNEVHVFYAEHHV